MSGASFIISFLKLIYKVFKLPGLLFLVFCVEFAFLWEHTGSEIRSTKYREEPVIVEAVSADKAVNSEGEVGYCFYVTVCNKGGEEIKTKIGCKGETGGYLTYDYVSEYQDIKINDPWRNKMLGNNIVPPGTELTLQFFVSQEELNDLQGDQLIFRDVFSESYATIPVAELKNTGKGGK